MREERWGVYAWWTIGSQVTADVHNTFRSQGEAKEYAAKLERDMWDSIVVCSAEHFDECWKLIGATVKGR